MVVHVATPLKDLSYIGNRLQTTMMQDDSSNTSCGETSPNTITPADRKGRSSRLEGKSIEEELCMICGDRASGYHYNALSCEGCKGFFRRSVTRGATYNCKNGGNCEMDMWMRRRCQACRLKRCREVGMKEECLLSDEQCKARDVRRKTKLKQKKELEEDQPSSDSNVDSPSAVQAVAATEQGPMDLIPPDYKVLITKLVHYQDVFELPGESDIEQVTKVRLSDIGRPKELNDVIYKQMAEMTILVTQLVVEFTKHLPGFQSFDRDDQIVLLKGSACEVMMLRSARRYDVESDTIIFANGMPYTRDNMRYAGLQDYVDGMFAFCRKMGLLAVDNAEYVLITAIAIFSERPGLKYARQIEEGQELYVNALRHYVSVRRPKKSNHLAKLLMMLTELRELSVHYSSLLFSLKIEKGSLPPLLCEYFDVVG